MIINHNIAALNTYGRLSANNAQQGKSLEKLSSGFRINRAGDDAAGLAISEKMRGQIRGLDQATRNAQDGISLIQTAEGALNEVHSILQRMKELATQSANDTYVASDRAEIQKEINQLSSEINRIGNTTEFNTQKLLNGGTQIKTNATASAAQLSGGSAAANTNATVNAGLAGVDAVAAKWNSGDITLTGGTLDDGETFSFGGVTITMSVAAADATHIAGVATLGAYTGTTATLNIATADEGNATIIRNGILAALNAVKGVGGSPIRDLTFGTSGASGLTATDTKAHGATNNAWLFAGSDATFANATAADQKAVGVSGATGVDGVKATADFTFTGVAQEGSSIIMADKTIAFWNSTSGNFANAAEAKTALKADFVVDVNGVADANGMAAAVLASVGATGIGGWTLANPAPPSANLVLTANSTGLFGGHVRSMQLSPTAVTAASGNITFTDTPAEGSYVSIGGQKIGFYDSSLGTYADDAEATSGMGTNFAVDTKGLTTEQIADKVVELQVSINDVIAKDVNLSKTVNANGSVSVNIVAQLTGFGGNTIGLDVSKDRTSGFDATLQIGANTAQSMTIQAVDMRSQALNITGNVAGSTFKASDGSVASFVSTANVTNGTTKDNVEFALDVSSHEKATAAISVLSDAITAVSSERSKLGAYQNRLEHTINNLGTSSENLTAAESRIRDVDMAKQMMEYTKNNILSQAATAMLAQANQTPQGVLQLLK
jgi:flagellin